MNTRTTQALFIVALALFVYIYFFERHRTPARRPRAALAPLVPGFRAASVFRVELLRTNVILRAERSPAGWRLLTPAYPAKSTALEALLEAVGSLTRRGHVAAGEILAQGGLAAFGLEPPHATLALSREAGTVQMRLGGRTPAGRQFYVQVVGEDGVYAVEDTLLGLLPAAPEDWRDPHLFSLRGVPWNRVEIHASQREVRVEKDPASGQWRMLRPLPGRADGRLVEQLVAELQATRVTRFVTDQPGADLEPFGLQTPEIVFTLSEGTNPIVRLEFGRSPSNDVTQVYARRSTHTNIVLVPREQLEPLRRPSRSFLERQLANVPLGPVSRVEVKAAETFALVRQPDGLWILQKGAESIRADHERVTQFLRDLTGLEVAEIAKDVVTELDLPSYGLAPAVRSYALLSLTTNTQGVATNTTLAQVDFGSPQTNRVFARRSDETTVYFVNGTAAATLPETTLELRDRQVWGFTTNQVASVTFRSGGQSRKLNRSPKGEWSLPEGGLVAPPLGLEELLYRLGQLKALGWTARKPDSVRPFGLREGDQEIAVELRTGESIRTLTLQFGRLSPDRNPYASTVLGEDRFVFEVDLTVYAPFLEVLRDLKLPAPPGS